MTGVSGLRRSSAHAVFQAGASSVAKSAMNFRADRCLTGCFVDHWQSWMLLGFLLANDLRSGSGSTGFFPCLLGVAGIACVRLVIGPSLSGLVCVALRFFDLDKPAGSISVRRLLRDGHPGPAAEGLPLRRSARTWDASGLLGLGSGWARPRATGNDVNAPDGLYVY